jgi:hypothetical protein
MAFFSILALYITFNILSVVLYALTNLPDTAYLHLSQSSALLGEAPPSKYTSDIIPGATSYNFFKQQLMTLVPREKPISTILVFPKLPFFITSANIAPTLLAFLSETVKG